MDTPTLVAEIIKYFGTTVCIAGTVVVFILIWKMIKGHISIKEERKRHTEAFSIISFPSPEIKEKVISIIQKLNIFPDDIKEDENGEIIFFYNHYPTRDIKVIISKEKVFVKIEQEVEPDNLDNFLITVITKLK